jgi:hypothetical protein
MWRESWNVRRFAKLKCPRGRTLEGAGGSDTINGGAGADILYGGLITDTGAAGSMTTGIQADIIHGGGGNDRIYSAGNSNTQFNYGNGIDAGADVYGDGGVDTIIVSSGTAHGGSENDTITVWGNGTAFGDAGDDILNGEFIDFHIYGNDGFDTMNMKLGRGFADGGNGGDSYHVNMVLEATIHDTGVGGGTDIVFLDRVKSFSDLDEAREGNNLVLRSHADTLPGSDYQNAVIILEDWYAGANSIEIFVLADGTQISGSLFS